MKKQADTKSKGFKGLWWKALLVLVVLLVAGSIFVYNRAIAFLHSDAFRDDVSAQVGAEVGSVVTFGDFKWDGLSAKNESFRSEGEGAIVKSEAKDIALDVKLDYIKRDKFRLKNVTVEEVQAELDLRKEFLRFEGVKKEKGFIESLLPDEVELLDAQINNLNALVSTDSGIYGISGVRLKTRKDDDSYIAHIDGGEMRLPFSFLSLARLEKGELVQLDQEIYVKDTKFKIFDSGEVTLNGVVDLAPRARHLYDMKGELSGLKCKDVFPDNWHRHLTGEVLGDFAIKPHDGTKPRITGRLEIKNGALQALPILNKISYYLAESKYRTLNFEKFECYFEKQDDEIHLHKIVLSSSGLLKIEGTLHIEGSDLEGVFDVGLPSIYLDKIPGAKAKVFKPGKDQLYWAKVRIGGTFDDITEDLSDRLIAAATKETILRMLKMGGDVFGPEIMDKLKNNGQRLFDNFDDILNGEKGILDGGLDAAQGLPGDITGSNKKKVEDDKKEGQKQEKKKDDGRLIPDLNKLLPF